MARFGLFQTHGGGGTDGPDFDGNGGDGDGEDGDGGDGDDGSQRCVEITFLMVWSTWVVVFVRVVRRVKKCKHKGLLAYLGCIVLAVVFVLVFTLVMILVYVAITVYICGTSPRRSRRLQ